MMAHLSEPGALLFYFLSCGRGGEEQAMSRSLPFDRVEGRWPAMIADLIAPHSIMLQADC